MMPAQPNYQMDKQVIKVYSRPGCVHCNATYKKLDEAGIPYEVIDASQDADATELVKNLGYMQAPVVYLDELTHWSGFRPDLIKKLEEWI